MSWREREFARLESGVYQPLPWLGAAWYQPVCDHYAHRSKGDPEKVAFTESPAHGEADRQTRMKPGRYLARYFADVLSLQAIEELSKAFANSEAAREPSNTVQFASDPDDIEHVYVNGPGSCMAGKDFDIHPARIYGAGDLAVAYLKYGEDDNIVARTVCWPERKVYMRIYGEYNHADTLMYGLQALGYSRDTCGFNGARLALEYYGGDIVCPYLDTSAKRVSIRGRYLVIDSDGDLWANETSGLIDNGSSNTCDRCDRRCDEDETSAVYTEYGAQQWCEDCYSEHSCRCESCDESHDSTISVHDADDCRIEVCRSCYDNGSYSECDDCSEHYANTSEAPNGDHYCATCYGDNVTACTVCHEEHMVTPSDAEPAPSDIIYVADVPLCATCEPEHSTAILDGPGAAQLELAIVTWSLAA